jgi:hypothetical protein
MAIDPTKPGSINPLGGPRVDQTGGHQAARSSGGHRPASPATGQSSSDDTVQLSAEALAAGQTPGATSPSGLGRDRLQEVLKRLTSGYYDSPKVTDHVARKVADELQRPSGTD